MQNTPARVFTICLALLMLILSANAQVPKSSISFVIEGRRLELTEQLQAVVTPDQGLTITANAGAGKPHLSIQLPKPAPGSYTLENAPGARISYAHLQSLDLRDHFQAGREKPNSHLLVTVLKFGQIGQPIEGTFTATVENQQGKTLAITEGRFSVVRVESPKGQKPQTPGGVKIQPTR